MNKAIKHLNTVLTHKKWVFHYCKMCGLILQGVLHDMSKFSPTEFIESVKYYQGTSSPIDACKKANGYSMAWFHHRGRNKHHWEFWVDDYQQGMIPKRMPFKYVLEMVCDYLGAGRAYMGDKFTIEGEYKWWQERRKVVVMHRDTLALTDRLFEAMLKRGIEETLTDRNYIGSLERMYNSISHVSYNEQHS